MIGNDFIVYADPDGRHYVAILGDEWWRWLAERGGWAHRERCQASLADRCDELAPRLGYLALRLSGVLSTAYSISSTPYSVVSSVRGEAP